MSNILLAGNNESPDTGQPLTSAVTGNNNTSHGSTNCAVTIGAETTDFQIKTCRWFSFSPGQYKPIKLQFNWSLSGSLTLTGAAPGTTQADASFLVEYSKDGGATWATALTRSYLLDTNGTTPLSDSGSVNLEIADASNSGVIQVRDRIRAGASSAGDPTVSASASIDAALNTLQLEATPIAQMVVMW